MEVYFKPLANLLLEDESKIKAFRTLRSDGLGSLAVFPDDFLVENVFGWLDYSDLLNLERCSRAFYVIANFEPIWKEIFRAMYWSKEHKSSSLKFCFKGSWKKMVLRNVFRRFEALNGEGNHDDPTKII